MTWAAAVALGMLWGLGPPDEAPKAVERVYADGDLQRDWPDREPLRPPPTESEPSDAPVERPRDPGPPRERPIDERRERDSGGTSTLPAVLLWTCVGVVVVLLLLAFARGWRPVQTNVVAAGSAPPDPRRPPSPPPQVDLADALAAEGRFDEAVHLLLLRAWALLAPAAKVPESFTSREAEAACRLDVARGAALRALVAAVEVSRFGGRALGAAEWEAARQAHGALARPGPAAA